MAVMPLALLALGFPVFLILLATSAILVLFVMGVPATQLHLTMFGSVDKFALIAVPFFLFAGELMGRGGMSRRIVDWVLAAAGGVRGSLGLTTVGACTVFGALSGSAPATVAALGRLLYDPLRAAGYGDRFANGLLTSSGGIAVVIPPSIAMILYGAAAEQSVALLFVAGVIPGLLIAALTAGYVYVYAARRGIREARRFDGAVFLRATRDGVWALGMPGIVLGGIYAGVMAPTEAAGVACVYAILVTRYIYRDITWAGIWDVAVSSMYLTAQVLIIVAAAGVFSWLLTVSGLPQEMVAWLTGLQLSPWMVLLMVNLLLLAVGCVLDPNSAILVLTPLLVPVMQAMGIDLIHFGIVMTVNLAIGMFTPPFGLNIFVAQAMFKAPLKTIYPGLVPFILLNLVALGLVTYLPGLSLWLTRFVG
ncbi:MAG: TRAP transporter large permease subunit [Alphaproteobacteria bacterium]|nr:TRAP transporter large permease subunit [Alphaproteobacteria bacterium]